MTTKHTCIHENDFGKICTEIGALSISFKDQKIAVDALLKYMYEKEAIDDMKEKEGLSSRQRASILVSGIIGGSAIITSLILKFVS
jgi:hypothetical protein